MTTQSTTWKPKPRRRAPSARIDLSSLMASFTLVFIIALFSMAIETSKHQGGYIELPATTRPTPQPWALRSDALQLAIIRTGDFYVSAAAASPPHEKMNASDIPGRLVSLERPGVERRVYVRADGRAKYGDVATALDAIRYAGLSNVTFMVEKFRPEPGPDPEP